MDQPARARSAYQVAVDGAQSTYDTFAIESRFTAVPRYNLWPQAKLHTQWPGNGSMGDPVFDHFYASTVPSLSSIKEATVKMKNAGPPLLDKIGVRCRFMHSERTFTEPSLASNRFDTFTIRTPRLGLRRLET